MRILILVSLLGFALAELTTYKEFVTYATKNNIKSVSAYATQLGFKHLDAEFEKFQKEYERHYTEEEVEMRKFYFLKTLEYIESHNALFRRGHHNHEVGINHFADWSPEEYAKYLNIPPMPTNFTEFEESEPTLYANLPPSFDWRQQNKVTPVKSQGQCGACWAFATTATIEAHHAIKHNQFISLSEQHLVDCTIGKYKNGGCTGGWVPIAYQYVKDNGIEMANDYPYHFAQGGCQNIPQKNHFRMRDFRQLPVNANDDYIMNAIMTIGPLAVNIDASGSDFGLYKRGILSTGGHNRNHYVTAIGWGTENNVPYWIVKNSWGTQWGEGGFGKMIRGRNIRDFNQLTFHPVLN